MASNKPTVRKLRSDLVSANNGDNGPVTPGGDDGRRANVLGNRISSSSASSNRAGVTGSCPPVHPRSALKKNSPLTLSSNGINTKPGNNSTKSIINNGPVAAAIVSTTNNGNIKKPPISIRGSPHNVVKGTKSVPVSQNVALSDLKSKYLSSDEEIETGRNVDLVNTYHGEVVAANDFLMGDNIVNDFAQQDEQSQVLNKEMPAIGHVKKFLAKESVGRSSSLPSGLGLCAPGEPVHKASRLSRLNSDRMSMSNNANNSTLNIMCGPSCHGLHFCLQRIPELTTAFSTPSTAVNVENSDFEEHLWKLGQSGQPTLNNRGSTNSINGLGVIGNNTNNAMSGGGKLEAAIPMQEAFSALLTIRNLANESGICTLEDYRSIANIETLILKIFSQGNSVINSKA